MGDEKQRGEYGLGELRLVDGKWYGRWRSPSGRKRNRLLGTIDELGASKKKPRAKLRELMEADGAQKDEGDAQEDDSAHEQAPTVGQLGARLIARKANEGMSKAHLESMESHVRVHLDPAFGPTPITAITEDDIEAWVADEREAGLSPKSIRNYLSTLHSIFELAIRKKHATVNPCRFVAKPKVVRSGDIRFLTVEELEAVVAAALDDDLGRMERVLWRTCAVSGLRMGETRGFRWTDIDWLTSRVRIRQTFVRGEFKGPKSVRGSRSVPLAKALARELELWFQQSAWQDDDDLVFCHPHTGRPYDGSKALKRYKAACKRAGVTKTNRLHDLRHTFGTQCAAQGVPMRTLQEWMGHEDSDTTAIYADYAPGEREAEWIDAAFAPKTLVDAPVDERQKA